MMSIQSTPKSTVSSFAVPDAGTDDMDEPRGATVGRWMSTTAPTLGPDAPLLEALHLMLSRWASFLPVLDEQGRPVGLLTHVELMQALARLELRGLERARVLDAMVTTFPTVGVDELIADTARRMSTGRYGCLLVVDEDGHYSGLLTEGDFLRSAVKRRDF